MAARSMGRLCAFVPSLFHHGVFYNILKAEWEPPVKPKASNPLFFCQALLLLPNGTRKIKLPLVDDPVNSLATSVLPMDADGLLKVSCD